jgi:hypothetical protein
VALAFQIPVRVRDRLPPRHGVYIARMERSSLGRRRADGVCSNGTYYYYYRTNYWHWASLHLQLPSQTHPCGQHDGRSKVPGTSSLRVLQGSRTHLRQCHRGLADGGAKPDVRRALQDITCASGNLTILSETEVTWPRLPFSGVSSHLLGATTLKTTEISYHQY